MLLCRHSRLFRSLPSPLSHHLPEFFPISRHSSVVILTLSFFFLLNPSGQHIDIPGWVINVAGALLNQLLTHPRAGALCLDLHHPNGRASNADGESVTQQLLRARLTWLLGMVSYTLEPPVLVQMFQLLLSMLDVSRRYTQCLLYPIQSNQTHPIIILTFLS